MVVVPAILKYGKEQEIESELVANALAAGKKFNLPLVQLHHMNDY
jgi:hypothetical protein